MALVKCFPGFLICGLWRDDLWNSLYPRTILGSPPAHEAKPSFLGHCFLDSTNCGSDPEVEEENHEESQGLLLEDLARTNLKTS